MNSVLFWIRLLLSLEMSLCSGTAGLAWKIQSKQADDGSSSIKKFNGQELIGIAEL